MKKETIPIARTFYRRSGTRGPEESPGSHPKYTLSECAHTRPFHSPNCGVPLGNQFSPGLDLLFTREESKSSPIKTPRKMYRGIFLPESL